MPIHFIYIRLLPLLRPVQRSLIRKRRKKEKERKAKRQAKHLNNKQAQKQVLANVTSGGDAAASVTPTIGCATREDAAEEKTTAWSASPSSAEQSDADVEDNLLDDSEKSPSKPLNTSTTAANCDPNGNNQLATSPVEKRGDSPENMDKDSLDEDENGKDVFKRH